MDADTIDRILSVDIPAEKKVEIIAILNARPQRSKAAERMARYRGRLDVTSTEWNRIRAFVLKRDKGVCQYCGSTGQGKPMHCDHIVPLLKGGKSIQENLVTACEVCNCGKSGKTPAEWRAGK